MVDWGVPDWRDPSAYPASGDLSDRCWWWEFTRRRPDYRALWLEWDRRVPVQRRDVSSRIPTDDPHGLRLKYHMSTLLDPRNSHGDWLISSHYFGPNSSMPPHSTTRHSAIEYGVWLGQNVAPRSLEAEVESEKKKAEAAKRSGMVTYGFDLSRPLAGQIKKAGEYLRHVQNELHGKQVRKPHRAQWPLYLRALDASDANATPTEMMKVFWPGDQKERSQASDTLELAKAVRDNFPLIL